MNDTTLIQIEDIKNVTSISDNIDVAMLEPFLFNAQEMYIRPVCGDALMDAMLASVASGGTGYTTLIDNQVLYALAYCTWYSAAPFLNFKTQRKGIVTQSSDNSTNVTLDEFGVYTSRIESMQTFYLRRLREFLDDNDTTYPLYAKDDDITPSSSSSIFLGFA